MRETQSPCGRFVLVTGRCRVRRQTDRAKTGNDRPADTAIVRSPTDSHNRIGEDRRDSPAWGAGGRHWRHVRHGIGADPSASTHPAWIYHRVANRGLVGLHECPSSVVVCRYDPMTDLLRQEIATAATTHRRQGRHPRADPRATAVSTSTGSASWPNSCTTCMATGRKVALVSSGAVGAGMGRLGLTARPTDLAHLQAVAAVGQSLLVEAYERRLATATAATPPRSC